MKKDVWKELGWERGAQVAQGGNRGHTFHAGKISDQVGEFNTFVDFAFRHPDRRSNKLFSRRSKKCFARKIFLRPSEGRPLSWPNLERHSTPSPASNSLASVPPRTK